MGLLFGFSFFSLRFYVLFWFLSLYDLYVPEAVYGQEIEKLQQVLVAQPLDGEQGDREDREAILVCIMAASRNMTKLKIKILFRRTFSVHRKRSHCTFCAASQTFVTHRA